MNHHVKLPVYRRTLPPPPPHEFPVGARVCLKVLRRRQGTVLGTTRAKVIVDWHGGPQSFIGKHAPSSLLLVAGGDEIEGGQDENDDTAPENEDDHPGRIGRTRLR